MSRPLIAVSAGMEELPTAFGERDCTKLNAEYTNAIYAAGGQPAIMPVTMPAPVDLLARVDGLLLTGGGDLDPELYGEPPAESVYGIRKDRDAFETALYEDAVARRLPILALCRGMQLINVLRGGTLVQEILSEPNHWQQNPSGEGSHEIGISPDSVLADVLGSTTAAVNSYHHQGIKDVGKGLRVTATCGDVIEGMEADDADIVAVQWHPEHMAPTSRQQSALFESLVKRAAAIRAVI